MGRVVLTSPLKPGIPEQIPLETRKRENSEDRRTLLNFEATSRKGTGRRCSKVGF